MPISSCSGRSDRGPGRDRDAQGRCPALQGWFQGE
jgi:hypothetical protein